MSLELEVDVWRCFQILKEKKIMVCSIALVAFFLACVATSGEMKDTYLAKSTVYGTASGIYSLAQAEATTTAMQRYAEVARSMKVLNRAVGLMNMEGVTTQSLSEVITVSFQKEVSILYIEARSDSPLLAISAANAVATAFVSEITTIVGQNTAQVLDIAVDYETEQKGEVIRWLLRFLTVVLALICSCMVILLLDIASTKIKSPKHASLNGQLAILGVIPNFPVGENRGGIQK